MHRILASTTRVALISTAILSTLSRLSFADPITITSSAITSTVLGPSADSLSWDAGSGSYDSDSGVFTFQTGNFLVGNSTIPDQTIGFSFDESITVDGITQDLVFSGQDVVTTAADTLTIFGGAPVIIGGETLTLQPFSLTVGTLGDYSVALQASVAPTPAPEPGSIFLMATGLFGAALVVARKSPSVLNR